VNKTAIALEKQMTKEQIEEAKKRTADWQAQHPNKP